MPRYVYECGECGHRVETFHSMAERLDRECPECEAPAFERLIFAPAFVVQGEGTWSTPPVPIFTDRDGRASDGATVEQLNRQEEREFQAAKKRAEKLKRREKKQGHRSSFRHVGRMPISEYVAGRQKFGEDAFRKGNTNKTLRRMGRFFGND